MRVHWQCLSSQTDVAVCDATTSLQRLLTPTPKKVAGLGLYVLGIFLCCFFVPNVPSPGARVPRTRSQTGLGLDRSSRPGAGPKGGGEQV